MANSIILDLDTTTGGNDDTTTYTTGGAAVFLAPNASVTANGNFNGQTLTVSGLTGEDAISIVAGGTVTISGTDIIIGGQIVGSFTGGNGTDFVITFTQHAQAAEVTSVLQQLTYSSSSTDAGADHNLTFNLAGVTATDSVDLVEPACFLKGTAIKTGRDAYVLVETLAHGASIMGMDGAAAPVKFVLRQTIANPQACLHKHMAMPIKISAGALGDASPDRDLYVSPKHGIFVDGMMIEAAALVNGVSITQEMDWEGPVEYYHIELADHALIPVHNVATETFIDNVSRATFDNHDEYVALYGEPGDMKELEYPRAKSARQLPKALKQKLADRAALLYPELVAKAKAAA
jgi:hypothetical protein